MYKKTIPKRLLAVLLVMLCSIPMTASAATGCSGCYMVVTCACTLNGDAVIGNSGNPNEVVLTWRRTNTAYYDSLTDCCHVYSSGVELSKKFRDADNLVMIVFATQLASRPSGG